MNSNHFIHKINRMLWIGVYLLVHQKCVSALCFSLKAACRHSYRCVCQRVLLAVSDAFAIHANCQPNHPGSAQRPSVLHQYHVARHWHLCARAEGRPSHRNCECADRPPICSPSPVEPPTCRRRVIQWGCNSMSVFLDRGHWICIYNHTHAQT